MKHPGIEREIDRIVELMGQNRWTTDEEYGRMIERLETLVNIQAARCRNDLQPRDGLNAATNLLTVLLIMKYEKLNVLSTKALSFLRSLRI